MEIMYIRYHTIMAFLSNEHAVIFTFDITACSLCKKAIIVLFYRIFLNVETSTLYHLFNFKCPFNPLLIYAMGVLRYHD